MREESPYPWREGLLGLHLLYRVLQIQSVPKHDLFLHSKALQTLPLPVRESKNQIFDEDKDVKKMK